MSYKSSISIKTKYNIDDLVNIIESHSENNIRLDALCKLEQVNFIQDKSRIVEFLENLTVSDEIVQVRSKALEILTKKFPDLAFKVSKWIIENEKYVILFSVVLKILSYTNSTLFNNVKKILLNRYVQHYKLIEEEAEFMMDLELLYSESYNALEFGSFINEPKGRINEFAIDEIIRSNHYTINSHLSVEGHYFYLRVGKHLRILDLSFLKSKLNEIPNSIGNLKRLKRLYLENNQLSALPSSMEKLIRLKFLSLNNNNFDSIHIKPLLRLKRLNTLFLNNNPIKKITRLDIKLVKKFGKIYEKLGVKSSNATILSLIETFKGKYPEYFEVNYGRKIFTDHYGEHNPDILRWEFSNDKKGYVTALGIAKIKGDILFKYICKLIHIEELCVLGSNMKNIPKSIRKLKSLTNLDLSYNQIEKIPKYIKSLKHIQEIRLNHNRIKKIPTVFKNLKSLKFLKLDYNKIKNIPDFFKTIKSLESLSLYNNNIKNSREIKEKLKNIRWLSL